MMGRDDPVHGRAERLCSRRSLGRSYEYEKKIKKFPLPKQSSKGD